MRRLKTDEAVMEQTRAGLPVLEGDYDADPDEALRPVLFPADQHIAVLVVVPAGAAPSEVLLRLDASGYEVWTPSTGRAAVELAELTPPDIILLDLDGMYEIGQAIKVSGFRVLHLLGRLKRERPVAVVVMTSLDFAEVEGPVRASADGFINKPIEPTRLIERLQGTLDRVRLRHRQRCAAATPAW
jgi:CheY-like chemotaxis protein